MVFANRCIIVIQEGLRRDYTGAAQLHPFEGPKLKYPVDLLSAGDI